MPKVPAQSQAPERDFMAGDQVQVVKDGDRRLGQFGTVVHIATQGAKVRFSDGQEEGFKRSSLHAPARLSFFARACEKRKTRGCV